MKSNKPVDLRKCKAGDKLLTCHGTILTYFFYDPARPYPHMVTYPDGSMGSRLDDGRVFITSAAQLPTDENVIQILPRKRNKPLLAVTP